MAVGDDAERQFQKRLKAIDNQFRAETGLKDMDADREEEV